MRLALFQKSTTNKDFISLDELALAVKKNAQKGDFWLLPEVFDTGFIVDNNTHFNGNKVCDFFVELAKKYNISIAGTSYTKIENNIYNRFFLVDFDGNVLYVDKRHPFGGFESEYVTHGNQIINFVCSNIKFRPIVCYDLRFPVWCRNSTNYDVLLCPSQWPAKREADRKLFLAARALENSCFVVNVNGLGNSMIYNPWGEAIFEMGEKTLEFFELNMEILFDCRKKRPYLADADEFTIKL